MKPLRQAGHSHGPRAALPSPHPPTELGATFFQPWKQSQAALWVPTEAGETGTSVTSSSNSASLPADVHPHGFLQEWLRWGGKSLSSNCHLGRDPAPDANMKLKFSSQLLLGLGFLSCSCGFATLTRAELCWQKGSALGGLRRAGVGFFPFTASVSASHAEKMQLRHFASTKKNTNELAGCWVRHLMTSHMQNCLAESPGSYGHEI